MEVEGLGGGVTLVVIQGQTASKLPWRHGFVPLDCRLERPILLFAKEAVLAGMRLSAARAIRGLSMPISRTDSALRTRPSLIHSRPISPIMSFECWRSGMGGGATIPSAWSGLPATVPGGRIVDGDTSGGPASSPMRPLPASTSESMRFRLNAVIVQPFRPCRPISSCEPVLAEFCSLLLKSSREGL